MGTERKVVVISGASTGIGLSLVEQLSKAGSLVFAGARKEDDIARLASIEDVHGVQLDITIPEHVASLAHHLESSVGHIDVLINNAGIPGWGAIIDREIEYFKKIMEVNLFGHLRMVKAFYPLLRKSKSSPIVINMSSQGGRYALPFWAPYHMSKWALEAFSNSLRRELMPLGIRVAVIQPGAIRSEAFKNQVADFGKYKEEGASEFHDRAIRYLQMAFSGPSRREKDPLMVADAVMHAVYNRKRKLYYQPGRRLVPDALAAMLPRKLVDWLLLKI